jgi:hemoglobin-like flavoprotein
VVLARTRLHHATMTSDDRTRLVDSLRGLQPDAVLMASAFFQRLFEIAPDCRRLFATASLEDQFLRVVHVLAEVAALHDKPENVVRIAAELGRRHVDYGVTDEHDHAVGEALLAVLDRSPNACPSPEARVAWRETYELVSGIMRRAAARVPRPTTER